MGRSRMSSIIMWSVVHLLLVLPQTTFAATYTVGDKYGWGPYYKNYASWVKDKTFHKGDVLSFQYEEGYIVQEVRYEDFKNCNGNNPLFEGSNRDTRITLKTVGYHYFICSVFDGCAVDGMKMVVKVT